MFSVFGEICEKKTMIGKRICIFFGFLFGCLVSLAQPLIPAHFVAGFKTNAFPGRNATASMGFLLGGQFDFSEKNLVRVNMGYTFGRGKNFYYLLSDPDQTWPDSSILGNYRFMHISANIFYQHFFKGDVENGGWYGLAGGDIYAFNVKVKNIPEKYVGESRQLNEVYVPGAFCIGGGGAVPLGLSGPSFFAELIVSLPFSPGKFGNSGLPFEYVSGSLTLGFVFPYKGYNDQ